MIHVIRLKRSPKIMVLIEKTLFDRMVGAGALQLGEWDIVITYHTTREARQYIIAHRMMTGVGV